jgi:hypothetical protein
MPVDARKVVGNTIQALAQHVTSKSECHRRYGSLWKTKWVHGVVFAVENVTTKTGRRSCIITAEYKLGDDGTMKRKALNVRSVKKVDPPFAPLLPGEEQGGGGQEQSTVQAEVLAPETNTTNADIEDAASRGETTMASAFVQLLEETLQEDQTLAESAQVAVPTEVRVATPAREAAVTRDETVLRRSPRLRPAPQVNIVATVNEQEWLTSSDTIKLKPVQEKLWKMRNAFGDHVYPGSQLSQTMSRLDFFLLMFPDEQLKAMIALTNVELKKVKLPDTNLSEVLKFFGILILSTRFEFGRRSELWSTTAPSKYRPAPCFGRTGMSRSRFDILFVHMRWSEQPPSRPPSMSSEAFRWQLVRDFVDRFNEHRASRFVPSGTICVDESISRWYGLGGYWINMGLPQYVAIDRKPENGCEIQNAADGLSGVMLRLKLVETAEAEDENVHEEEDGLLHGTKILKYLVQPWAGAGDRTVCADSYFASVGAAEELEKMGLGFIGVVKTATKRFPQRYLSSIELQARGDTRGVYTTNGSSEPAMMAFVWMDRDRRYFIASRSSLEPGLIYSRARWRQVDLSENADPERVELEIPQPKAAEAYYRTCSSIDRHNRSRQDDLMLVHPCQPLHFWYVCRRCLLCCKRKCSLF